MIAIRRVKVRKTNPMNNPATRIITASKSPVLLWVEWLELHSPEVPMEIVERVPAHTAHPTFPSGPTTGVQIYLPHIPSEHGVPITAPKCSIYRNLTQFR